MKYLLSLIAMLAGCASHIQVAPVTVQPIHLTIDVNVHDDAVTTPRP